MNLEALPWVLGLVFLAMVIAWLNDRTKGAEAREKDQKNPRAINSWRGAWAFAGIMVACLGAMVIFGEATARWWTGFVILALLLFAVLRFVGWPLFLAKMRGEPIVLIKTQSDGTQTMKCPTCRQYVPVEQTEDVWTIHCPTCERFTA